MRQILSTGVTVNSAIARLFAAPTLSD